MNERIAVKMASSALLIFGFYKEPCQGGDCIQSTCTSNGLEMLIYYCSLLPPPPKKTTYAPVDT